jgi:HEAT repeats
MDGVKDWEAIDPLPFIERAEGVITFRGRTRELAPLNLRDEPEVSKVVRDVAASMGWLPPADASADPGPTREAEERAAWDIRPLTLKTAKQGDPLVLKTEDGSQTIVTIGDVLNPAAPRADYDAAPRGQHLVAVQIMIENKGPGVFAYDPSYESKLIGGSGGEYGDWQAELTVPTFRDVVRLAPGDSRKAHICYAIDDADRPLKVEIVFGLDSKADIGQWEITDERHEARAAGSVKPVKVVPRAPKFSDDPDEQARMEVAHALETLPTEQARDFALKRLNSLDFEIRSHALFFLEKLADPTLATALRGRLSDPEAYLRQRAIRALKTIGTVEALDAIRPALEDPDAAVRGEASRALAIPKR